MTIRITNKQDLYRFRVNDYNTKCYIVCYIEQDNNDNTDTIIAKHLMYEAFPRGRFVFGSWRPFFSFKVGPRHLSWDAGSQYNWLKQTVFGMSS